MAPEATRPARGGGNPPGRHRRADPYRAPPNDDRTGPGPPVAANSPTGDGLIVAARDAHPDPTYRPPPNPPPMTPTHPLPPFPTNDPPSEQVSVPLDQHRFWSGFHEYARRHARRIRPTKPQPQDWMRMSVGRRGFSVNAIANSLSEINGEPELRAEFQTRGSGAKAPYEALRRERSRIEHEFGRELEWHSVEQHNKCRIFVRRAIAWQDPSRHQECFAWLVENLDRLHRIFHARVRRLL